jgi:hypothetical protein
MAADKLKKEVEDVGKAASKLAEAVKLTEAMKEGAKRENQSPSVITTKTQASQEAFNDSTNDTLTIAPELPVKIGDDSDEAMMFDTETEVTPKMILQRIRDRRQEKLLSPTVTPAVTPTVTPTVTPAVSPAVTPLGPAVTSISTPLYQDPPTLRFNGYDVSSNPFVRANGETPGPRIEKRGRRTIRHN